MWQYIQARQAKNPQSSERRPRSFLIVPDISGPRAEALKKFNVHPVAGRTETFLAWLKTVVPSLPSRLDLLRITLPGVVELLSRDQPSVKLQRDIEEFGTKFEQVPSGPISQRDRSAYLIGATPRWIDIVRDLDAPREYGDILARDVRAALDASKPSALYIVEGSAGCGKSTILRRLGLTLAREGHPAFLTNSEELPTQRSVETTLEQLGRKALLLFDNAEVNLPGIVQLAKAVAQLPLSPIIVLAARANEIRRRQHLFDDVPNVVVRAVPHLSRPEIVGVIQVLDDNNLLGKLRGMTRDQQIMEFETRANKQILVAMREATSGRLFDEIIRDEFHGLVPDETKILYLAVALATDAGYRLSIEDFLGCSMLAPADSLDLLEVNLRDIVLKTGSDGRQLVLRHRKIAEFMVDSAAPRTLLKESYIRLLSVLAGKVQNARRASAIFKLYRELINHHTISVRFSGDEDQARDIYDSLSSKFSRDSQFWLQYGSLELDVDNLDLAENYLNQADSLDHENGYIHNALGHLAYRRAVLADSRPAAQAFRSRAKELLQDSMDAPDKRDAYAYHIAITQELKWILKWVPERDEQSKLLEELRLLAERAKRQIPNDRNISLAVDDVERHYLLIAVH
jgi:tetratricopeptide (TPR) repeat protein